MRSNFYSRFSALSLILWLSLAMAADVMGQIVISNSSAVYMRMSGGTQTTPICLVVNNSSNKGISCCTGCAQGTASVCATSGSPSWIVSEGQYNYVVWRSLVNGTSYLIPVGTTTATAGNITPAYLPVAFLQNSGTTDRIALSTWTTGSDNKVGGIWNGISDGLPGIGSTTVAAVTSMNTTSGIDGTVGSVIDRWWDIDASGSTNADVTFRYRGSENTMTVSPTGTLAAQHWTGSYWNNGQGGTQGTKNSTTASGGTVAATVYSATATGLTEFTPYVLVSDVRPLPVTWLNVSAECNRGDITVKWSTASEQNSDYFTVERSYDGSNFTDIANVLAAGQSSTVKNYSFVDEDPIQGVSYYRIHETDFNSSNMVSAIMTVNGCSNDDIFIYGNVGGISVNINAAEAGKYTFELYDLLGQKLMNETKTVVEGENHLKISVSNISSAIYVAKVCSENNVISKKVFIRSAYSRY